MILKINQINNFPTVYEKLKTKKLPFKISYKFAMLANEIQKNIEFYQEQFRSLIAQYGKRNEEGSLVFSDNGEQVIIEESLINEAQTRLVELNDLEINLTDIFFSSNELENIELTPEEISVILPFIKE